MYDTTTTSESRPDRRRALLALLALLVAAAITAIVLLPSHASHAARGNGTPQPANGSSSSQSTDPSSTDTGSVVEPAAGSGSDNGSTGVSSSAGGASSGGSSSGGGSSGGSGSTPGSTPGSGSHDGAHSHAPAPGAPDVPPTPPAHVTAALAADYGGYYGVCTPFVFHYTATITASRPTDVTYQWIGASTTGTHTVHVSGSVTLTSHVDMYRTGSGSVSIQVLSPTPVTSNSQFYSTQCTEVSIGTARSSSAAYTGDCTHGHTMHITVPLTLVNPPTGGTLQVHYHWVFSDGGTAPEQTVSFPYGTTSQTVGYDWTFFNHGATAPATNWVQLVLDDPYFSGSSNQASFSIWCV